MLNRPAGGRVKGRGCLAVDACSGILMTDTRTGKPKPGVLVVVGERTRGAWCACDRKGDCQNWHDNALTEMVLACSCSPCRNKSHGVRSAPLTRAEEDKLAYSMLFFFPHSLPPSLSLPTPTPTVDSIVGADHAHCEVFVKIVVAIFFSIEELLKATK